MILGVELLCPKEVYRKCCSKFYPKEVYYLTPKDYAERILEVGFCPKCGVFVAELRKLNYDGHWSIEYAKRKKAFRLYEANKNDITRNIVVKLKYGNKSNMGFHYGENVETKEGIKQYSVDFNGSKELQKKYSVS